MTTASALSGAAARGSAITIGAQAIRAVVQFATVILLTRLLSPDDFGVLAMVVAITGFAEVVRDFGLSSAVLSARKVTPGQRTNLFWLNSAIGFTVGGTLLALSPLLGLIYNDARVAPVAAVLSVVLLLNGMSTQFIAGLARDLRYFPLAAVEVGALLISSITAIALAANDWGLRALVAQQIILASVTLLGTWGASKWTPGLPHRGDSIRSFVTFGANLLGTKLLAYAAQNADSIALGIFWNARVLGLYSRAYQLVSMPLNQLNAPLTRVALPVLSRLADDRPRLVHYLSRAQLASCYLTAPVLVLLAGLSGPVVDILFGERWREVAPILALLCIGTAFRAVSQVAFWMYLATDNAGAQLRMYLVTQPLVIIAVVVGATQGVIGAAIGYSVGYFVFWLVAQWHACRTAGIAPGRFFSMSVRALLLFSLPFGIVGYTASAIISSPLLAILAAIAGCFVATAIVWTAFPSLRRDLTAGAVMASKLWRK